MRHKYRLQYIQHRFLRIIIKHLQAVSQYRLFTFKDTIQYCILEYVVILHLIDHEMLDIVIGLASIEINLQIKYRQNIFLAYLSIFIPVLFDARMLFSLTVKKVLI